MQSLIHLFFFYFLNGIELLEFHLKLDFFLRTHSNEWIIDLRFFFSFIYSDIDLPVHTFSKENCKFSNLKDYQFQIYPVFCIHSLDECSFSSGIAFYQVCLYHCMIESSVNIKVRLKSGHAHPLLGTL